MFVYHMHVWYPKNQKNESEALELELQTVVSCHVGARNQTLVVWKSNQCS